MEFARLATLVLATITMGLIAGLFYGFCCSVMLALARTDDRVFVDVMQKINAAIQNGWFSLCFLGAPLLTVIAGVLQWRAGVSARLVLIVVGLVLYLISFGITVSRNIPLNLQLDAAGPASRALDPAAARAGFERPWVRLHLIRTLFTVAGFASLCIALAVPDAG